MIPFESLFTMDIHCLAHLTMVQYLMHNIYLCEHIEN